MLLFIHGTGATNSFWIPQIRGIFSLDQSFSDKYILDLFTVSLPGHPKNDKYFDLDDLVKLINEESKTKQAKQEELATQLMFSKNKEAVEALRDPKLILIGHSLGGVAALAYSFRNLNTVSKIVLVSCAFNFNQFTVNFLDLFYQRILFHLSLKNTQNLFQNIKNIRLKTILSICLENPARKGLKSCAKITKSYSFDKIYKPLSLNEQLKFSQIPILGIGGKSDSLVAAGSFKKLKKYLDRQDKFLSTKKVLIQDTNKTEFNNFKYKLYSGGHEPMDNHQIRFMEDVREFLTKS